MIQYKGKKIIIMACSKCNINCKHCYISYSGNRKPEELLTLVKELKKIYEININGAEILTAPRYLESYKEIGQNFVMSNGLVFLQNPIICKTLKVNGIDSVSLSYHFGIQNEVSQISYEKFKKIIEIIKNNELNFRLLTTITKNNYKMVDMMCEEAKKLGAKGIKFTNFINQGNAINLNQNYALNEEKIQEFLLEINKIREKYSKSELIIERCGTFGKSKIKDNFCCNCIKDLVVLTPDNNVYPCVFLAKPGFEIGKMINYKIYLNDEFYTKSTECLSKEICNNEKQLMRRIK